MGLVRAFLNEGHEVIAIAPEDEYSSLLEKEGCKYYPLKMQNKGNNPLSDTKLFLQLYRIYKETKPDIVLQFTIKPNIYGSLAASFLSIPVINNVSGLGTVFIRNNWVSRIARMLYQISFRFPSKVFFQNNDDRELFLRYKLVKDYKTEVIPGSGIDLQKFEPGPFVRNKPFVFLVIARILIDKGILEYAEAAKIIKDKGIEARFLLMGAFDPGPLGVKEVQVRQWIKEDRIEYIPFQKDVKEFIRLADCVVLPSYREGTPKTLLEGAAMKKPLIATDVPGCKEVVVNGENGFLCKVKDPYDLAFKMEKLMSLNENELETMGGNGRKLVLLKYDEKIVITAYKKAITEAIEIGK